MLELTLLAQSGSEGDAATGMGLILFMILFGGAAYFFPLLVAMLRGHHQTASVAVINIFLGWTFIGWVVALAMSFSAVERPARRARYQH